jgi:hypothetical protein
MWTKPPTWNAKNPRAHKTTKIIKIVSSMPTSFLLPLTILLPAVAGRLNELLRSYQFQSNFNAKIFPSSQDVRKLISSLKKGLISGIGNKKTPARQIEHSTCQRN